MRKKVLYVITKSVWGGAQRYVYDLATNLPQDKFETAVVAGGSGLLITRLREAGIRTLPLETLQEKNGILSVLFDLSNFSLFFKLLKIFHKEKPDIIHLNSSKTGGIGALAAFIYNLVNSIRKIQMFPNYPKSKQKHAENFDTNSYKIRRVRIIFTVHGWPFKEDRFILVRLLIFCLSWLSSLLQDKIILINKADYQTARKFIPERKLCLIHNGIAKISFFNREEARTFLARKIARPLTSNTIIIGSIAELTENKGLRYFIDALSPLHYRELASIVIGGGEEELKLKNYLNAVGVTNVFLIGFVPEAQRYLKGFDIFVLPSLKEGLPYAILEAMFAELPIVATNVGGIPDLIVHKKSGLLVPPKNINILRTAIEKLLANPQLRKKMGKRAAEDAKLKFTLNIMLKETASVYEGTKN